MQPQKEWSVSESPLDSDHCIIEMKIQTGVQRVQDEYKGAKFKCLKKIKEKKVG